MDTSFALEVNDTANALRRGFERRAAEYGVTRGQWRVLLRLSRADGQRQVDLAEAIDVEPITLCRMIDRLEDSGLVERRKDEEDRRAWRIHLTPKAGPAVAALRDVADRFLADALAGVSEADQEQVRGVLARVRANLAPGASATRRAS